METLSSLVRDFHFHADNADHASVDTENIRVSKLLQVQITETRNTSRRKRTNGDWGEVLLI